MSIKNTGKIVASLAGIGIVATILLDVLGVGKPGLQSGQLLVIMLGTIALGIGIGLIKSPDNEKTAIAALTTGINNLLAQPTYIWVLAGFGISFLLFWVWPVFFNEGLRFSYYYHYIPDRYPIGVDFLVTLDSIKTLMLKNEIPPILYPPLMNIVFSPFLLLGYPDNYYVITALTLFSLIVLIVFIPRQLIPAREHPLIALTLITALISYGVQFELERGQSHTLAFMLCIVAAYLFHSREHFRWLAYWLFSISIQMKVYPVIFIVLFIRDWRDWRGNIKRFVGLGLFNFGLLFLSGPQYFVQFIQHMVSTLGTVETWIGNHSIKAFTFNLVRDGFGLFPDNILSMLKSNEQIIETTLLLLYLLCFGLVLWQVYQQNLPGLNLRLLFVCTMGSLMVPALNHDYTLGLLAGPFVLFTGGLQIQGNIGKRVTAILLIIVMALAYSSLLYPFKYRPPALISSFPMLFIVLIISTLLTFILPLQPKDNNLPDDLE
jgi:hypothetical protein